MAEFFQEGKAYVSQEGTFLCNRVVYHNGVVYALGMWSDSFGDDAKFDATHVKTLRDADFPDFEAL